MPGHVYAAVVPVFLEAALSGRPLPVNGDGENSRDFTYVETVVETITRAVRDKVTSTPVNLAFGTRTTLNELVRLIEEVVPRAIEVHHGEPRPGDVLHSQAANDVLTSLFPGLHPVSLRDGLVATFDWMSRHIRTSKHPAQ